MTTTAAKPEQVIDWSVASRALPGETVSGDLHAIVPWSDGVVVAVIDGLGHGDEATVAARAALQTIEQHPGDSVVSLVQRCHRAMIRTRGAAMTIVSVNALDNTVSLLGVGNVEMVLLRADPRAASRRESVLLRGGVVGYQLPPLQASVLPIAVGDILVFATDGVREDFADLLTANEPVAQLVERILAQKFRGTDDGLVLACRYVGRSSNTRVAAENSTRCPGSSACDDRP